MSAVLITGGSDYSKQSAEVYHPDRDSACLLPDLPDERWIHTQDGSLLCGGYGASRSCLRWNPMSGSWDLVTEAEALTGQRFGHSSWTPADGSVTYLIGDSHLDWESGYTSEIIDMNNNIIRSFPLRDRIL